MTCIYEHMPMYIYIYRYIDISVYIFMYICIHTYTYMYICICIYIHFATFPSLDGKVTLQAPALQGYLAHEKHHPPRTLQ